ncbi:MAG: MIP/aquaporin family protein, partial [Mycobacteriales bacterium]
TGSGEGRRRRKSRHRPAGVTAGTAPPGRAGAPGGTGGTGAPARGGWHLAEWGSEFAGTALLLIGGLSAICLDFGPHSPVARAVPSHSLRLLVTGLLFAGTGSLVAVSPLGRCSGAHLNPAVTLAFWLRRHVHPHDLAGYVLAQVAGAFAGVAVVGLAWGSTATAVNLGVTQPGSGLGPAAAAAVEAAMTAVFIFAIFGMVSSTRTARFTPLVLWVVIAVLVWQGAPYTGTSLNPARSLAPAVLRPDGAYLWVYVVGPLAGALLAVAAFALVGRGETLTAKLFHDPAYRSTMRTLLPARGRRG